jgi:diaminohydroxyphosphoribosylaminopyrimidine deaminase/5-amino-6-(5-phosphoribosylamino)uracil reductase
VIVDGRLRLPLGARVVTDPAAAGTVVVTTVRAGRKVAVLRRRGVRVLTLPGRTGTIALPVLLRRLATDGVSSVLIEGGGGLAAAAVRARVVDRMVFFFAPKLIGGDGVPMIGALGIRTMAQAVRLRIVRVSTVGVDLLVHAVTDGGAAPDQAP